MMKDVRHVLDHGYVKFIEAWGYGESNTIEAGIIEAARQSTEGSFRGWDQDQKLLAFLYNSNPKHATPFEFAGMVLEAQLPIFVTREWHRHRTQSYNELSARYTPLPNLNYVPDLNNVIERAVAAQESKNKQARAAIDAKGNPIEEEHLSQWIAHLQGLYAQAQMVYHEGLALGIPKELARLPVAVGRYTRMRASANLRNWLAFLTLRMDPAAQWEIRQYANAVGRIIEVQFPRTYALFSQEMQAKLT